MKALSKWLVDVGRVFRQEWKMVLSDMGVMLFFLALPLAYPIVYTLIYNPELVRQIPVCVVDDARTPESREMVRQADAAPAFKLWGYAANMNEAKKAWANNDVYAIMHIPSDYSKKISSGEQAHVSLFCDMSLLLRYRALVSAMTSLQLQLASDITIERLDIIGLPAQGLGEGTVNSEAHFLGDTQQGFASFVIPGIVVLILQQSLMLGAALLGGTARDRRRANGGLDPKGINDAGPGATVLGKALVYTMIYIPMSIYILHFIPEFFHLPHYGDPLDYLLFIFPMLLAAAFLGQALVFFIREREYVFPVLVFTSVIFLFLSGLTWPRYGMSTTYRIVSGFIPSTWGVEGFVRINSNAATLGQNIVPYLSLWVLAVLYFLLAYCVTLRLTAKRVQKHGFNVN